jgi:hypothetical protein
MRNVTVISREDRREGCSCAACRGFEPWASRFAGCIQSGWMAASEAVAVGAASRVPVPGDDA